MLRNLAQPFLAGGFERGAGVEAAGDDAADEGGALFFQQRQHAFLLGNQSVDAGGFAVEVVGDNRLIFDRRNVNLKRTNEVPTGARHLCTEG